MLDRIHGNDKLAIGNENKDISREPRRQLLLQMPPLHRVLDQLQRLPIWLFCEKDPRRAATLQAQRRQQPTLRPWL